MDNRQSSASNIPNQFETGWVKAFSLKSILQKHLISMTGKFLKYFFAKLNIRKSLSYTVVLAYC
jgi:hypothetical protein